MILLNNNMLIFPIKVLHSKRSISKIELINGFERNLDLMNLLISIIFKHIIITFHNLFNILFDFIIHLVIKPLFHRLTQLLAEPIFYVDKNDEEKDAIAF